MNTYSVTDEDQERYVVLAGDAGEAKDLVRRYIKSVDIPSTRVVSSEPSTGEELALGRKLAEGSDTARVLHCTAWL